MASLRRQTAELRKKNSFIKAGAAFMDEILCVSPSLADAFLGATAFRLCLFSSPTSKA